MDWASLWEASWGLGELPASWQRCAATAAWARVASCQRSPVDRVTSKVARSCNVLELSLLSDLAYWREGAVGRGGRSLETGPCPLGGKRSRPAGLQGRRGCGRSGCPAPSREEEPEKVP